MLHRDREVFHRQSSRESLNQQARKAKVDRGRLYPIDEAVGLLHELCVYTVTGKRPVSFDQTAEAAFRKKPGRGYDPRQSEHLFRKSIVYPHGLGTSKKVVAAVRPEFEDAAREAGADVRPAAEISAAVREGLVDFDVLIITPDQMGTIGPVARVLGPRGLMPTPRAGTATNDPVTAIKEFGAGRVDARSDNSGNIHAPFGKVSMGPDQLIENFRAALDAIRSARPKTVTGDFPEKGSITATMMPGIKVDIKSIK